MDALALLCTLHADGPTTLKRLREAGCASLDGILGLESTRLVEILGTSATAATRFQREARLLGERIGSRGESADGGLLDGASDEVAIHAAIEPPAALPARRPYEAALERWRELDAADDASAAAETIVEESSAPAPHVPARTTLAALGEIDEAQRSALERAGVADLEELAAANPLELARASGLDFTNVIRLAALARRALRTHAPDGTEERFSPAFVPHAPTPPLVRLDEELELRPAARPAHAEAAGGPFA